MSDDIKTAAKSGLIFEATNIGFYLIGASFLWIFAPKIATFVLNTLEKHK